MYADHTEKFDPYQGYIMQRSEDNNAEEEASCGEDDDKEDKSYLDLLRYGDLNILSFTPGVLLSLFSSISTPHAAPVVSFDDLQNLPYRRHYGPIVEKDLIQFGKKLRHTSLIPLFIARVSDRIMISTISSLIDMLIRIFLDSNFSIVVSN